MPRKQVLTSEYIKNKIGTIARKVERGEIDPKVGNCLATLWGKALYAIQVQSQTEETKRALERLAIIEDALATGNMSKLQQLIVEEDIGYAEGKDGETE